MVFKFGFLVAFVVLTLGSFLLEFNLNSEVCPYWSWQEYYLSKRGIGYLLRTVGWILFCFGVIYWFEVNGRLRRFFQVMILVLIGITVFHLTRMEIAPLRSGKNDEAKVTILPSAGKLALKSVSASSSYSGTTPLMAVDGDSATVWNSGGFPLHWLRLTLTIPSKVSKIRLMVAQTPAGKTRHDIWTRGAQNQWVKVAELIGDTNEGQWLEHSFNPPLEEVLTVQVVTPHSPSWVAWHEVEMWE